jgi:DNA modification methylase
VTTSPRTRSDAAPARDRVSFGSPSLPPNRLVLGDNLRLMRALRDASIDLIYVDPPFYTGREHAMTNGDAGFSDTWPDIDAYVAWLSERFAEMRRLLAPTGVLCVHCDWHAGHYIKVALDRIFGAGMFRNEIVWHYGLGAANATRHVLRKHDTIFVYGAPDSTFHRIRGDVTSAMLAKYCHEDERGRYMMSRGRRYYLKGGKPLDSVWNIPAIAATSRERAGYPTQKPLALLDRIIRVWSNEHDLVADVFCGSGTTGIAAQQRNRRWLLCDDSPTAIQIATTRLKASAATHTTSGQEPPDVTIESIP